MSGALQHHLAMAAAGASGPRAKKQKVTAVHVAVPKIKQESGNMKICAVSLGAESGWRDICVTRVEELKSASMQGLFGVNTRPFS